MSHHSPYLIAIAGSSCSGKTELTRYLCSVLDASVLTIDSYYREMGHMSLEERAKTNFDEPASLDEELVIEHVRALVRGQDVPRPTYDFATHTRTGEVEMIHARQFVIVEGLFTLHWPQVRNECATRVYIHTDDEICFERRLSRDTRERGRTEESVKWQYASTVRPMAELYVWPTQQYADIVVSGIDRLEHSGGIVLEHVRRHREQMLESALSEAARTLQVG